MNIRSPKYQLVMEQLTDLIADAEPGTPVPTERALATRFGTSRTTVRQALAALAASGRVARTQGSGTFVAEPKRVYVHQLTSYSEDLRDQGHTPTSQVIDVSRVKADPIAAAALDVEHGTQIYRVERVRMVDDEPLAVEVAHVPGKRPRLRAELERRGSLYATLRGAYDVELTRAKDQVEAAQASAREAAPLGIEAGAPMLAIHRTAFGPDDRPIEYTRSVFRGDRFRFVASSSF